jgi:hypothetical protein
MTSADELALVNLFRGLDRQALADIDALATPLNVTTGTILVEEGTHNDALFVLLAGSLRVVGEQLAQMAHADLALVRGHRLPVGGGVDECHGDSCNKVE